MAKVKELKKYESSYLKIMKKTSVYKTSLEPFSFVYSYDFVSLKLYVLFLEEDNKGHVQYLPTSTTGIRVSSGINKGSGVE